MKKTIALIFLSSWALLSCDNKTAENNVRLCQAAIDGGALVSAEEYCALVLEQTDPEEYRARSESLYVLGQIKRQMGKFAEAEPLINESLVLEHKISPEDNQKISLRLYELALCSAGLNKWQEGAIHLEQILPTIDTFENKQRALVLRLASVYTKKLRGLNQTETADRFEKILIQLNEQKHDGGHETLIKPRVQ